MQLQKFLGGNLYIYKWRFPRTTEDDVQHMLLKKEKENKKKKEPYLVTQLFLNQRNFRYTVYFYNHLTYGYIKMQPK